MSLLPLCISPQLETLRERNGPPMLTDFSCRIDQDFVLADY